MALKEVETKVDRNNGNTEIFPCGMDSALLTSFADRDTDAGEEEVRKHIEQCPDCWERLRLLVTAKTATAAFRSDLDGIEIPADGVSRIMAHIHADSENDTSERTRRWFRGPIPRRFGTVAAVAVLILMVAVLFPTLYNGGSRTSLLSPQTDNAVNEESTTAGKQVGTSRTPSGLENDSSTETETIETATGVLDFPEDAYCETQLAVAVLSRLTMEKIQAEVFHNETDGANILAIRLRDGADSVSARQFSKETVLEKCVSCETQPVIEIMEGVISDENANSPESLQIQENFDLLPGIGASVSDDLSGQWLILTWRVSN